MIFSMSNDQIAVNCNRIFCRRIRTKRRSFCYSINTRPRLWIRSSHLLQPCFVVVIIICLGVFCRTLSKYSNVHCDAFLIHHVVNNKKGKIQIHQYLLTSQERRSTKPFQPHHNAILVGKTKKVVGYGWLERNGEWEWVEDDPLFIDARQSTSQLQTKTVQLSREQQQETILQLDSTATPQLPSGEYRPKQSLGQNYLKDPNTVSKILRAFHLDATTHWASDSTKNDPHTDNLASSPSTDTASSNNNIKNSQTILGSKIIELGPGAGALTDKLVDIYGPENIHCIEIDDRSVRLLLEKHPSLSVDHEDVLQINYSTLSETLNMNRPLTIIGNLPYYITSQILFALADSCHTSSIHSATVTMQKEVGQRIVAKPCTKEYGILSVVFQIYCSHIKYHFKIPPTVFYPQPKVDSALLGFHFLNEYQLQSKRLNGVHPTQLRTIITTSFRQRRKTLRNSLKSVIQPILLAANQQQQQQQSVSTTTSIASEEENQGHHLTLQDVWDIKPLPIPESIIQAAKDGDVIAQQQELPINWSTKRPEELTPGQFIELTRLIYSLAGMPSSINSSSSTSIDTSTPLVSSLTTPSILERDNDSDDEDDSLATTEIALGKKVWRKLKHGEN